MVALRVTVPPIEMVSFEVEILMGSGALTLNAVEADAEHPFASVKV